MRLAQTKQQLRRFQSLLQSPQGEELLAALTVLRERAVQGLLREFDLRKIGEWQGAVATLDEIIGLPLEPAEEYEDEHAAGRGEDPLSSSTRAF